MKITIDKKHKEALQKACINLGYQVQFLDRENDSELGAYITTGNGRYDFKVGDTAAFWLGAAFEAEKLFEEQIKGVF